ncbi:DUF3021 family protein [Leuconostoc palmae]|uniref:DUF3021 family protein n=1 Tax=Leuconostoc palmae TaxID=501487 RepID=UPI001C7DB71E|nr:DUF3021 family protein [Leuconostoc palmae]
MNLIKLIIKYVLTGIAIGSFFSLLSVTVSQVYLSMQQFALLMTMSALMGLISIIFKYDKLSYLVVFISHFILEMLTYALFIWLSFDSLKIVMNAFPSFLIIYVVIFLYSKWQSQDNARRINQQLMNKKKTDNF